MKRDKEAKVKTKFFEKSNEFLTHSNDYVKTIFDVLYIIICDVKLRIIKHNSIQS